MAKRQLPQIYNALDICDSIKTIAAGGYPEDRWGPARWEKLVPINPFQRLVHRARVAWGVFSGRYDALTWQNREGNNA